jgi:hypothetical protein
MAEIHKPQPKEVLLEWIKAIEDEASDDLTSWETDFVDSVKAQVLRKGTLSLRQEEILENIYSEKTS